MTNPLPFIGLAPCRIADTRGNGFTGAYGPPSLAGGVPRNFTLTGQCGIPSSAGVVSLNITVVNTAGPGFILIYPQGGVQPTVSTLNYVAGQTVANAAIVPLGTGGGITVIAGVSGTDLIIDTNGYYYNGAINNPLATGEYFSIIGSYAGGGVLYPWNHEAAAAGSFGLNAFSDSTGADSSGVHGKSNAASGKTHGVFGETSSAAIDSSGVRGIAGDGVPPGSVGCCFTAGVRGDSLNNYGVVGISKFIGTFGLLVNAAGTITAKGELGLIAFAGPWGVFAEGNVGATGTKPFVEVHPTDASKLIRYVALEGPEAGTYFRGRAKFENGSATIRVPESFRLVTDTDGLTVQITPIGSMASYAVTKVGLDEIVVRGSKDVEFFYMVNGVRETFKDWQVIVDDSYVPDSAEATLPAHFSAGQKRRLIANGTYNEDETVNMSTAARLGWTRIWADRTAAAEKAAAEARSRAEAMSTQGQR